MMGHTCNRSTWEVEERESGVQSNPQQQSKLEDNLGYMKL